MVVMTVLVVFLRSGRWGVAYGEAHRGENGDGKYQGENLLQLSSLKPRDREQQNLTSPDDCDALTIEVLFELSSDWDTISAYVRSGVSGRDRVPWSWLPRTRARTAQRCQLFRQSGGYADAARPQRRG